MELHKQRYLPKRVQEHLTAPKVPLTKKKGRPNPAKSKTLEQMRREGAILEMAEYKEHHKEESEQTKVTSGLLSEHLCVSVMPLLLTFRSQDNGTCAACARSWTSSSSSTPRRPCSRTSTGERPHRTLHLMLHLTSSWQTGMAHRTLDCPLKTIRSIKDALSNKMVHEIVLRYPSSRGNVRYGVLAYRDVQDEKQFERLDFTTNTEAVVNFLSDLRAKGGKDYAEDVLGAMLDASKSFNWQMPNRVRALPPRRQVKSRTRRLRGTTCP